MRRGLTMIELLLALSLLAVVMLAVASWTQVTAQASATAAGPVHWRAAAEAMLQLIHDDLATGDFGPEVRQTPVAVIDGVLEIHTRAGASSDLVGPVTHRYRLDASAREMKLEQRTASGRRRTHLLLDRVDQWKCAIDDERETLTVTIASREGSSVTRSYVLQ